MKNDISGYVGILLSGGESRRFGEPKAFAKLEGKTFAQIAVDALTPHVSNVVIVSLPSIKKQFESLLDRHKIICDRNDIQGKGPLAGILTVMDKQKTEWYIVLPCDMPLINEEIIRVLKSVTYKTEEYDAIIPIIDGRVQPLVGIYHSRCKPIIEKMLENSIYKVTCLLEQLQVSYVKYDDFNIENDVFNNVNTKEDFREMYVRRK